MPNNNENNIHFLYELILLLKNEQECAALFDDLYTPLAQRAVVARMLSQKRVYSEIVAETGASTATVSRVNRSLTYGKNGYDTLFARLDGKDQ